ALTLECKVECSCNRRACPKSHARQWTTNYKELKRRGTLGQVEEFQIILLNQCRRELNLDKELETNGLSAMRLPNVNSLVFLGEGVFTAGRYQDTKLSNAEVKRTGIHIISIFPNITRLEYFLSRDRGSSSGNRKLLPGIGTKIVLSLLNHFISQLTTVQILVPFMVGRSFSFSNHLTSLTINDSYLRQLTPFPSIPVAALRRVQILKVVDKVNWGPFEKINDSLIVFPHVEEVTLQFVRPDRLVTLPEARDCDTLFPRLNVISVMGVNFSSMNFLKVFGDNAQFLRICDNPRALTRVSSVLLDCAQNLQLIHTDPRPSARSYSVLHMRALYEADAGSLYGARMLGIEYPLPETINWSWMMWLHMTASIADPKSIAHMVGQLPALMTLVLECFSMNRDDLLISDRNEHFGDQAYTFVKADSNFYRSDTRPISKELMRFEICSHRGLDLDGLVYLVGRLPSLVSLGVNKEM
ncbi:hypothetical protein EC988_003050, partial [Linderina pennispora]